MCPRFIPGLHNIPLPCAPPHIALLTSIQKHFQSTSLLPSSPDTSERLASTHCHSPILSTCHPVPAFQPRSRPLCFPAPHSTAHFPFKFIPTYPKHFLYQDPHHQVSNSSLRIPQAAPAHLMLQEPSSPMPCPRKSARPRRRTGHRVPESDRNMARIGWMVRE